MEYIFRSPYRTWTVKVTEMPDRVVVAMSVSKLGKFGDEKDFNEWLGSKIKHYDSDPRPLQVTNPHSGEVMTVWGDASSFVATLEKRKDIH